jgi:murein L,D-transpeptidase YafK
MVHKFLFLKEIKKYLLSFVSVLFLILSISCLVHNSDNNFPNFEENKFQLMNYKLPLHKLMDSLKIKKTDLRIIILKSKYMLQIATGDSLIIKSYPVVFGFNPIDDKLKEGDGCTPEGNFKVKAMYPHKSWSKFMWLDYPNEKSWAKHKKAKANGLISKKSAIGGDIGIHGVPAGDDFAIDRRQNWTLGCISLKNKDVNEIYKYSFIGMIVEIKK